MLVFDSITSLTSLGGPGSTDQGPVLPRATEPAEAEQTHFKSETRALPLYGVA